MVETTWAALAVSAILKKTSSFGREMTLDFRIFLVSNLKSKHRKFKWGTGVCIVCSL